LTGTARRAFEIAPHTLQVSIASASIAVNTFMLTPSSDPAARMTTRPTASTAPDATHRCPGMYQRQYPEEGGIAADMTARASRRSILVIGNQRYRAITDRRHPAPTFTHLRQRPARLAAFAPAEPRVSVDDRLADRLPGKVD